VGLELLKVVIGSEEFLLLKGIVSLKLSFFLISFLSICLKSFIMSNKINFNIRLILN